MSIEHQQSSHDDSIVSHRPSLARSFPKWKQTVYYYRIECGVTQLWKRKIKLQFDASLSVFSSFLYFIFSTYVMYHCNSIVIFSFIYFYSTSTQVQQLQLLGNMKKMKIICPLLCLRKEKKNISLLENKGKPSNEKKNWLSITKIANKHRNYCS